MNSGKIYLVTLEWGESLFAQLFKTNESAQEYVSRIVDLINDMPEINVKKSEATLQVQMPGSCRGDASISIKAVPTNRLKYALTRCEYGMHMGEVQYFKTQEEAIEFVHNLQNKMLCKIDKINDSKGYWELPDDKPTFSYRLFCFLCGKRGRLDDDIFYKTLNIPEDASDIDVNKALGKKMEQIYLYGDHKEADAVRAWAAGRNIRRARKFGTEDHEQVLKIYALVDFYLYLFMPVFILEQFEEARKKHYNQNKPDPSKLEPQTNVASTVLGVAFTLIWWGFLILGIIKGWWWIWFFVVLSAYCMIRALKDS